MELENTTNKLLNYCREHIKFDTEKQMNEFYVSCGINRLLHNILDTLNESYTREFKYQNKMEIIAQALYNDLLRKELEYIALLLNKEHINWVHLKGTTLSDQLYEKDGIRSISDIDILVHENDLATVMELVKNHGYDIEDTDTLHKEYKKNNSFLNHLPPLQRKVGKQTITLEIHTEVVPYCNLNINNKKTLTETLLNTRKLYLENKKIYILDDNSNLIFLVLHCVKHFIYDIKLGYLSGNFAPMLSLNLLHDIALFINNMSATINWNTIIDKIHQMQMEHEFHFVLKLVNEIYNNIPTSLLDEITFNIPINSSTSCKICYYLIQHVKISDILFSNLTSYIHNMLDYYLSTDKCYLCKNRNNYETKVDYFIIDENKANKLNPAKSHIIRDFLNRAKAIQCQGGFEWNNSSLYLKLKCAVDNTKSDDSHYYHFYLFMDNLKREKNEMLTRYLKLKPQHNNDKIFLEMSEITGDSSTIWSKKDYAFDCSFENNTYDINLEIPWERLDILPYKGMQLRFDLCVNIVDLSQNDFSQLSLNNPNYYWYDLLAYAHIKLI